MFQIITEKIRSTIRIMNIVLNELQADGKDLKDTLNNIGKKILKRIKLEGF